MDHKYVLSWWSMWLWQMKTGGSPTCPIFHNVQVFEGMMYSSLLLEIKNAKTLMCKRRCMSGGPIWWLRVPYGPQCMVGGSPGAAVGRCSENGVNGLVCLGVRESATLCLPHRWLLPYTGRTCTWHTYIIPLPARSAVLTQPYSVLTCKLAKLSRCLQGLHSFEHVHWTRVVSNLIWCQQTVQNL